MESDINIKEGYKKTRVGYIPEDWEIKLLNDVCAFRNGKAHEGIVDENAQYVLVNSKFVSSEGVVVKKVYKNLSPLFKGEIAIVMSDVPKGKAIAKCFHVDKNDLYTLNQRIGGIKPKIASSRFLYYQLNRNKYYLKFDNGVSQTNLRKNEILECPLRIPPLPEQKAIANCLTTWDRGIEKLSALIKAKKEQKKGLMQQLLTGEKRLDGFEGEWKEVKLVDVAKIVMGVSPSSSNYNNEKHGMLLIQGNADIKNRISKPRQYTSEITKLCSVGDILMSVRAPVGEISKSIHNACIGRGICAIQNKKYADNNYLYYYLVYTEVLWNKFKQGSTFESVNTTDIKNFILTIPAIKEQTAIAEVLTTADKQIALLEKKLERFKEQKRGLMQVLLTGERRLIEN